MSGCRGCLGRLVRLALLTWAIGELAKVCGWSNATNGTLILVVLGLLAIGGIGRGRASRTDRVTRRPVVLLHGPSHLQATPPWVRSLGSSPPRRGRSPALRGTRRACDLLPAGLRFGILACDGFRCRYCGRPGSAPGVVLHVDHFVPLAEGGSTSEGNLLTACEECNLGKGTRAVVAGGS